MFGCVRSLESLYQFYILDFGMEKLSYSSVCGKAEKYLSATVVYCISKVIYFSYNFI